MKHCRDIELIELASGRRTGNADLRAHLESCAECRARYDDLSAVRELLGASQPEQSPRDLWPSIARRLSERDALRMRPVRPLALRLLRAAAVLLAGVGLGHGAARLWWSRTPVAAYADRDLATALSLHALERPSATGLPQLLDDPAGTQAPQVQP